MLRPFPQGGIFRAERHFLLFKDQLAESGRQNTKENIIPHGKFRLVEIGRKQNLRLRGVMDSNVPDIRKQEKETSFVQIMTLQQKQFKYALLVLSKAGAKSLYFYHNSSERSHVNDYNCWKPQEQVFTST